MSPLITYLKNTQRISLVVQAGAAGYGFFGYYQSLLSTTQLSSSSIIYSTKSRFPQPHGRYKLDNKLLGKLCILFRSEPEALKRLLHSGRRLLDWLRKDEEGRETRTSPKPHTPISDSYSLQSKDVVSTSSPFSLTVFISFKQAARTILPRNL